VETKGGIRIQCAMMYSFYMEYMHMLPLELAPVKFFVWFDLDAARILSFGVLFVPQIVMSCSK
jgi:hypothetical protein